MVGASAQEDVGDGRQGNMNRTEIEVGEEKGEEKKKKTPSPLPPKGESGLYLFKCEAPLRVERTC